MGRYKIKEDGVWKKVAWKNEVDSLAANVYTKAEVDNKVSAVYKFKGSVATFSALPVDNLTVGDVYNVSDTGINYAWDGTAWDDIGGIEALATASNNGLISKEDFAKLQDIAVGATKVESSTTNGNIKINGVETEVYDDTEIVNKIGVLSNLTTTEKTNLSGAISEVKDELVQHKLDYMPHRFQDIKNNKKYKFGFQLSAEGNPQIIFEEVI